MRVAVVGSSGSGKTTLAQRLERELSLPRIELDAINWQAGWRDLNTHEPEEFVRRVDERIAADRWVCDGNYGKVRLRVWARATCLIWLDYDRSVIMPRVIRRSFARAITGRELWEGTGNREEFGRWFSKDHPIRWAWDTWARRRVQFEEMLTEPQFAGLTQHRLRHPRELEPLIAALKAEAGA
ncbi:hypothetical protein [Phenylobacterium sp.]|uniref:hypothetical protein n=1 Tax=Phenylobacterium sp. TaxID=1871053 RepID=UPI0035B220BC